jgi:hypothetical protein
MDVPNVENEQYGYEKEVRFLLKNAMMNNEDLVDFPSDGKIRCYIRYDD